MDLFFTILLFLAPIFLLILSCRGRSPSQNIPPGSLGFPIIGQSLNVLRAMRANTAEKWFKDRAEKYGPVSKLSLFGKPTVFIYGQVANKFVFTSGDDKLDHQQTTSIKMILGDRNILELTGGDHKRVREALMSFLKPESLKQYVGKIDEEVRRHLQLHWNDKEKVTVLPLMKTLTFNIICSLLFGVEVGTKRDELLKHFQAMMEGMWSIPINFPFTRYNRSLGASKRVRNLVKELIHEKRAELEKGAPSHQDLITCLLSTHGNDNEQVISEDEIVHNVMLIMVAGHDTSAVVLTFFIRLLANDSTVLANVCQEQEDIAKNKSSAELLSREDLCKMKYTWKVAMEILRMFPPIFGGFRKAVKDIEYDGYLIPKGWQIFWVTGMNHMDENIFQEPSKFDPERFENQRSQTPQITKKFKRIRPISSRTQKQSITSVQPQRSSSHALLRPPNGVRSVPKEAYGSYGGVAAGIKSFGQTRREISTFEANWCKGGLNGFKTKIKPQFVVLPSNSWSAFGGGYRICPGYEFAKIETLTTIHYLVTRFTWKLLCKDDSFSRDPMPVPNQGLPVQIAPKN